MADKRVCPLTRTQLAAGRRLTMTITDTDGNTVYKQHMPVREFSTKSVGYNASGKAELCIDGKHYVDVQIGANITVIGSKELAPSSEDKMAAPAIAPGTSAVA